MDPQHLQNRLTQIQNNIDGFKQKLIDSEKDYQRALRLLTNPGLKSSFMERHVIYTERRKSAIDKMEVLYKQVQHQVASL